MTELNNVLTLGFKVVAAPGPSLLVGGPCGEWGAKSWTDTSSATCGISSKTSLGRNGKMLESKTTLRVREFYSLIYGVTYIEGESRT